MAWETACRAAAADAGISDKSLSEIGLLSVADCYSWSYDDAPQRLADRLAARPAVLRYEAAGGTSAHVALAAAVAAVKSGEVDLAIICGGEMMATRKVIGKAGETPNWSFAHPNPVGVNLDVL